MMNQENTSKVQTFQILKEQFHSADSDDRRWVLYETQKYAPEEALDMVLEGVRDGQRAVRAAAAEVLENWPPEKCVRHLIPILASDRLEVRNLVAGILVSYGASIVADLTPSLTDPNRDVRKQCADILGLTHDGSAVPMLCQVAIQDPDKNVVSASIEALGKIGDPEALPTLHQIIIDGRGYVAEAIEAMGLIAHPDSTPFLLARLHHQDPITTFAVVDALGNVGSEKAISYLLKFFMTAPDYLKTKILLALLKIGNAQNVNVLNDFEVRIQNLHIDILSGGDEEIIVLTEGLLNENLAASVLLALFDKIKVLPARIVVALIRLGRSEMNLWDQIIHLAEHEDEWISYSAIESLEYLPIELITPILEGILQQQSGIRLMAAMGVCERMQLLSTQALMEQLARGNEPDAKAEAQRILSVWTNNNLIG